MQKEVQINHLAPDVARWENEGGAPSALEEQLLAIEAAISRIRDDRLCRSLPLGLGRYWLRPSGL